jgi:hypothetical protein
VRFRAPPQGTRLSPRCSATGGRRLVLSPESLRDLTTPNAVLARPMLAHGFAWRERCDRQPKLHGPGATGFRRMGFPNPIRSDTSCRGTTSPPAGDSGLACDPTKGRLTRASAKKTGIRRTRGAFHRRAGFHRGSGVIHSLSPRCGEHRCHHGTPALFALPRVPLPLTRPRRRGAGSISVTGRRIGPGPHPTT